MSDGPRIDLAIASAAGLPERAALDGRPPSTALPMLDPASRAESRPGDAFSPLALLLARFLPPAGTTTPPADPTPEEARLLHAYLQQRVVALLRAEGLSVSATAEVRVDSDGALQVTPAPAAEAHVGPLLRHEPDIAQLAAVLQRALLPPAAAMPRPLADEAAHERANDLRDEAVGWPRWLSFDTWTAPRGQPMAGGRVLSVAVIAALLLGSWLFR